MDLMDLLQTGASLIQGNSDDATTGLDSSAITSALGGLLGGSEGGLDLSSLVSHRRSTDLAKGAVRPPKFSTGITSTLGIRRGIPNAGARHEVSRAQPFPWGASLDLWQYTLNLYSVYAGCSLKMPLRGEEYGKRSPCLTTGSTNQLRTSG